MKKYDIKWEGNSHQAGSDSLVTMKLFCKRNNYTKDDAYENLLRAKLDDIDKNMIYKFDQNFNSDDEQNILFRKQTKIFSNKKPLGGFFGMTHNHPQRNNRNRNRQKGPGTNHYLSMIR